MAQKSQYLSKILFGIIVTIYILCENILADFVVSLQFNIWVAWFENFLMTGWQNKEKQISGWASFYSNRWWIYIGCSSHSKTATFTQLSWCNVSDAWHVWLISRLCCVSQHIGWLLFLECGLRCVDGQCAWKFVFKKSYNIGSW